MFAGSMILYIENIKEYLGKYKINKGIHKATGYSKTQSPAFHTLHDPILTK